MHDECESTQDETARDVVTRWSCGEMEEECTPTAMSGPWRQTSGADLRQRRVALEAAPRLVSPGAASHRQQCERRKNLFVGMIAALACFGLCWMATSLIAEAVSDALMGAWWRKSIGVGLGWLYIRIAQAADLPAARRGALCGWITYLLFLPWSLHGT